MEVLLREKDLTLDTAITKCRAQEAARKQRIEISRGDVSVQAIRKSETPRSSPNKICPGCGSAPHSGGRQQCPATNRTCNFCKKIGHFARVCHARRNAPRPPPYSARSLHNESPVDPEDPSLELNGVEINTSSTANRNHEPAPMIEVHVSSLNGQADLDVLPDSGADISVAGPSLLHHLSEHPDNLLPSTITPRTVNGSVMQPMGKLPVTLSLESRTCTENFHIYRDVDKTLLSWKTTQGLSILPTCYPQPLCTHTCALHSPNVDTIQEVVLIDPMMLEFPSVFDGQIKVMEGEEFHITLTENAKPFCIRTPRSIPFAYRDKLKAELDLLQSQGVIAPITIPTEWCAPIVV